MVNSKSEDEDEEKECEGDDGKVWDLELFAVRFPIFSLLHDEQERESASRGHNFLARRCVELIQLDLPFYPVDSSAEHREISFNFLCSPRFREQPS